MSAYQDPIITAYSALIKSKCGAIKAAYQGEPIRIPASELPCMVIAKSSTQARAHTDAEDEQAIALTISVITDVRNDLSTEEDIAHVVAGISSLYDICEGRNEDYTLKDTSILGILRHNLLVDPTNQLRTDLGTITRVDYGQTFRDRPQEQWSVEAKIELVAYFTQNR